MKSPYATKPFTESEMEDRLYTRAEVVAFTDGLRRNKEELLRDLHRVRGNLRVAEASLAQFAALAGVSN